MEKNIFAYKCRKCGELHYPYRMVCKKCRENEHNEFDPVPLPKTGKLLTFTYVHNLPADFMVSKLGLGIVELTNGLRMVGQIRIDDAKIGMDVIGKIDTVRSEEFSKHEGMIFYKK
jgi:uncharacterized OB-fold protein